MIDLEAIGSRIKEQRKYIRRVSQEKMAEDLLMYQADVSNLEKAKPGSGITDLAKLDAIADYFGIPLETLLFGREDRNAMKYHGSAMRLRPVKRRMPQSHSRLLHRLTGIPESEELPELRTHECGPYLLYSLMEYQFAVGGAAAEEPPFVLPKLHTYVFLGAELTALMTADVTTVMQHIFQPHLGALAELIPLQTLDVTDVWRTLNPYWALWQFTEEWEPEYEAYYAAMFRRMDALRSTGEDRKVLYIEQVYVREDCRRCGLLRMYVDLLKLLYPESILWLNMEPTSGSELTREYDQKPVYTVSEVGQLNLNAAIAERLGFTVDPDTWHRQAETVDADGVRKTEVILVRKCAYYLPPQIRKLLRGDGNLVALGRAKQKLVQAEEPEQCEIDLREQRIDGYRVIEWAQTVTAGPEKGRQRFFYAARREEPEKWLFGVSYKSVCADGLFHEGQLAVYTGAEAAAASPYSEILLNLRPKLLDPTDLSGIKALLARMNSDENA